MPDTEVHKTWQVGPDVRGVLQVGVDGTHVCLPVGIAVGRAKRGYCNPKTFQGQPQIKAVKGLLKLFCLLHAPHQCSLVLCFKQNFLSGHVIMRVNKLPE